MFHNGRDCVACQPLLLPTVNLFPLCIPSLPKQPGPERFDGIFCGIQSPVNITAVFCSIQYL